MKAEGGAIFKSLYLYGSPDFEVSTDWMAERREMLLEDSKAYVDAQSAFSAALRDLNHLEE